MPTTTLQAKQLQIAFAPTKTKKLTRGQWEMVWVSLSVPGADPEAVARHFGLPADRVDRAHRAMLVTRYALLGTADPAPKGAALRLPRGL